MNIQYWTINCKNILENFWILEKNIYILGLDSAGKTTLVYKLTHKSQFKHNRENINFTRNLEFWF
jgi:GTPase SAR1 family protein